MNRLAAIIRVTAIQMDHAIAAKRLDWRIALFERFIAATSIGGGK